MRPPTLDQRAWVEQIMGLPVSVHLRGADLDSSEVRLRVRRVYDDLRRVEAVFSPYLSHSDLSRWERGELSMAAADPSLLEVVELCDQARDRTGGWFDPRGLPAPTGDGTRYDPSGLVKGWAVQRAAQHLAGLAGRGWCINAGGDVIASAPDGQRPWRVGVEDPDDPSRVIRVVDRDRGAVATSGSAHRGAHIIDPHTRRPASAVRAVTVIGPELIWADVFATAAAARGATAIDWLEGLAGYDALMITAAGRLLTTADWPAT